MTKREIDTPAKDDPNRKKPRQKSPEGNAKIVESVESDPPAAAAASPAVQNASVAISTSPAPAALSPVHRGTPKAVGTVTKQKNEPVSAATKNFSRSLVSILGSGSAKKKPAIADKKERRSETTAPAVNNKKGETLDVTPQTPDIKKDRSQEETDSKVSVVSQPKRNTWVHILIAALGILNITSISYLVSEQSRHNIAQMKCFVDNEKLNEDLSRNRGVISVLQSGLEAAENQVKFLEQAHEAKKKQLKERREKKKGVGAFTEEEKRRWAERKSHLTVKRDQLRDDFNYWVEQLDKEEEM